MKSMNERSTIYILDRCEKVSHWQGEEVSWIRKAYITIIKWTDITAIICITFKHRLNVNANVNIIAQGKPQVNTL